MVEGREVDSAVGFWDAYRKADEARAAGAPLVRAYLAGSRAKGPVFALTPRPESETERVAGTVDPALWHAFLDGVVWGRR